MDEEFKCDYDECENEEVDISVILPCGYEVCLEHLQQTGKNTFECIICSDHQVNLFECLSIKRNKEKVGKYELQTKIDELDETIQKLEEIEEDAENFIEEAYEDLMEKIETRREQQKSKLSKSIDDYYDKLVEQIESEKEESVEKLEELIEEMDIDELKVKKKKFLKLLNSSDPESILKEIEKINEENSKIKDIIDKPNQYEFTQSEIAKTDLQKLLGILQIKPKVFINHFIYLKLS